MMPRQRPTGPRPDDAALLRYVSGESPLAESEAIREWLEADADLAASVAELRAAWSNPAPPAAEWDKAGVWARLARETQGDARRTPTAINAAPFAAARRRAWIPVSAAAAAVLVIAAGIAVHRAQREAPMDAPVTMREVATARGQQAVMDLPDGSRVTLAADSRLEIPSNFDVASRNGTRRRELRLEGRAYFVVVHDSTRPFLVHTATATTEDIGTAFVISAYPERRATQVVVAEGAVSLSEPVRDGEASRKPLMLLTLGDVATLDSSGTATLRRNVDVARYVSWTQGILTFDGARLADVIPEMERWYDVEIRLADARLGERRLSAQLRSEPVESARERLALVLGVEATIAGRVITLAPVESERRR